MHINSGGRQREAAPVAGKDIQDHKIHLLFYFHEFNIGCCENEVLHFYLEGICSEVGESNQGFIL